MTPTEALTMLHPILDTVRDTDPLVDVARMLIDAGVMEEQVHEALKTRAGEPIAVAFRNVFRDVVRGVPTRNKWE